MKRKSIIAIAVMFALLTACTCGCGCGGSETTVAATDAVGAAYVKYTGEAHNTHVYDFTHDCTHYRSFTVASSGTFVVNVTLDSLQQEWYEHELENK